VHDPVSRHPARPGHRCHIAIAAAVAVAVAIGLAASHGLAAEPDAVPSSRSEYLPSISDLMIATIQPRHERLWRAEQDGDWEFAAYELGKLVA